MNDYLKLMNGLRIAPIIHLVGCIIRLGRDKMKLEWYNQELLCILAEFEVLKQRLFHLQKEINDECFQIDYWREQKEKQIHEKKG